MLRMGLGMVAILTPLQMYIGDASRPQHREVSAREDRRDRSALGRQQAGRPRAVRHPQLDRGAQRLRDLHSGRLEPAHHALLGRALPGAQELPAAGPAAGHPGVLRLPHHGRHGRIDADRRLGRRVAVGARASVHDALVPARPRNTSGRWASSPSCRAGTSPRSGVSRGSPTASCEPPTRPRRLPARRC